MQRDDGGIGPTMQQRSGGYGSGTVTVVACEVPAGSRAPDGLGLFAETERVAPHSASSRGGSCYPVYPMT